MVKRLESGRSMIEMLGVLAIIGILSAAGILGYKVAMDKYRSNKAMEGIQFAANRLVTYFSDKVDYSDITANDAKAIGIDMTSPFGSEMDVHGGDHYFTLVMGNVPQSVCIKLAQAEWEKEFTLGSTDGGNEYTLDPFSCADKSSVYVTYDIE